MSGTSCNALSDRRTMGGGPRVDSGCVFFVVTGLWYGVGAGEIDLRVQVVYAPPDQDFEISALEDLARYR